MDIHTSNILGIIFENLKQSIQLRRIVYFVVDKPPYFYHSVEAEASFAKATGTQYVRSRISHPSITQHVKDSELGVCSVPWMIQYSRVYKIEYEPTQNFDLASYKSCLTDLQKSELISFHHPRINDSERSFADLSRALRSNLDELFRLCCNFSDTLTCQLSVLRLLYNCNLSATSAEAESVMEQLQTLDKYLTRNPRQLCENLNTFAQDIGTSQHRALQRFYEALPSDHPKLPEAGITRLLTPTEALDKTFSYGWNMVRELADMYTSPGAFEVQVYPSHVELQGPIDPSSNSITDQFRRFIDQFIRVRFMDNNMKPLKVEHGVSPSEIMRDRIFLVLRNERQPLLPIRQKIEYLGYSVSSFKKKNAVWFLCYDEWTSRPRAREIRNNVGKWDYQDATLKSLAITPSKWGARIALAFTESMAVHELSKDEWDSQEDYGNHKDFPNTDGCGLIHPDFCDTINAALAPLGFAVRDS